MTSDKIFCIVLAVAVGVLAAVTFDSPLMVVTFVVAVLSLGYALGDLFGSDS